MFRRTIIFAVVFCGGIMLAYCFMNMLEGRPLMALGGKLYIFPNGSPGHIRVVVRDVNGEPISKCKVAIEDVSATSNGETNSYGKIEFTVAEERILVIGVSGKCIARSNIFRTINCKNGLDVYFISSTVTHHRSPHQQSGN